jgi:hypothetical protein
MSSLDDKSENKHIRAYPVDDATRRVFELESIQ